MTQTKNISEREFVLLKTWMDQLLSLQIESPNSRFDGGILCPSCLHFHGRIIDSIYPLMFLAEETEDKRYLNAAKKLFKWGDNLFCDDDSYYNDAQQTWNNTTIFFAQSLENALERHGTLLDQETYHEWTVRLRKISDWMLNNFSPENPANTNYHAACSAALAMCGNFFKDERYLKKAKELADFCLTYITPDNFIYGEGNPRAFVTKKGCYSIDVGYSLEESLPSLVEYAERVQDQNLLIRLTKVGQNYLNFILPDGGMDNSFGTRNFKWTYWGSRTSDGCLSAFSKLGQSESSFLVAVNQVLGQLENCTDQGYLFGGPDYKAHGEPPCIHHMFAHSKVLADCLDQHFTDYSLSEQSMNGKSYFPAINTYVFREKSTYASVTATDYAHFEGGHIVGGSMGMLWNEAYGPIIASGITDTTSREPLNTQLSLKKSELTSSAWRMTYESCGIRYSNIYDLEAKLAETDGGVEANFMFADIHHHRHPNTGGSINYQVTEQRVEWNIQVNADGPVHLTIPVCARKDWAVTETENIVQIQQSKCRLSIFSDAALKSTKPGFSLAPGFELCVLEYVLEPAKDYHISFEVAKM